jgi:hypothetical protein
MIKYLYNITKKYMYDTPIPMTNYIFASITALVIAFASVNDVTIIKNEDNVSDTAISSLPFMNVNDAYKPEPDVPEPYVPEPEPEPVPEPVPVPVPVPVPEPVDANKDSSLSGGKRHIRKTHNNRRYKNKHYNNKRKQTRQVRHNK